jgi:ornithine carbamoyltransferase
MTKHVLSVLDLTHSEIEKILRDAEELKGKLKKGEPHELLRGKTLGMLFAKPSTRTRVSFETGMTQLGGHAIYMGWNDLQLGRGETIADTARTLSRYVDAIMARLFKHEQIVELARYSSVPVLNGLTDTHHPCQTLADLMTIREKKGRLKGLKLAWVGDFNNVCNSITLGGLLMGMNISVATPEKYWPNEKIKKPILETASKSGAEFELLVEPEDAVVGADVVYTDVIVSMGMETEREQRMKDFQGYQVNSSLIGLAKKDVIFMHCLPAHRGEEVTDEVIDGPHSVVFDQAENRLHAQKALLVHLLAGHGK